MEKPNVLAACPPFALPPLEKALGADAQLVPVNRLDVAEAVLKSNVALRMIVCGVHFDESRMYELLELARRDYPGVPFVCARILDAEIPKVSREALRIAAETMGAEAFIDLPELVAQLGPEAAEEKLRELLLAHLKRDSRGAAAKRS